MSETQDILERLHDLHRQATEERSHYYTGRVIKAAAREIAELRKMCEHQERFKHEANQRAEKAERERDRIRQETIEAAAKVCEEIPATIKRDFVMDNTHPKDCAKAIRALGEKP